MSSCSLLVVGDIHLGRRPGRVPDDLREYGVDPSTLTPAAAWRRVVEHAIAVGVDSVVLAGDVVDEDNARFEAFGHLHDGVRQLLDRSISVFAVVGNHDVVALPRLADEIAGFHLLGRGGKWESTVVNDAVQLVGWSFPTKVVRDSPVASGIAPVTLRSDIPAIGVLHCDLASSDNRYAPVSRRDLERVGLHAWLLGHIHVPSDLSGARPIGYLGSLMGLDPTETGKHGPWLVRVTDGQVAIQQEPIAPLRWEQFDMPVDGHEPGDDVLGLAKRALQQCKTLVAPDGGTEAAVGCRIRLTGTTPSARALRRTVEAAELQALRQNLGNFVVFIDKVICAFRGEINLDKVAESEDPPGIIARQLISLDRKDDAAADLVRTAKMELRSTADRRVFSQLADISLSDEEIRQRLREAGYLALEEMLARRNGREEEVA